MTRWRYTAGMRARTLVLGLAVLPACGDDSEGDSSGAVTTIGAGNDTSGGGGSGDTNGSDGSDGSTGGGESGASSSGGADSTSGGADSTSGDSGGAVGDPMYPMPAGGMCPDDTVNVTLPGAEVCAPFCTGEGAACPAAATGNGTPICTPFAQRGGSEDPCDDSSTCPEDEACSVEGICVSVAFWACRLLCDQGEACPDGMMCAGALSCGYP